MELGGSSKALLPWHRVKEVVKRYKLRWEEDPAQQRKRVQLAQRCSTQEDVERTVASNFRTHCYEAFGGKPWLHWFIAIGDITAELVSLANDYLTARVRQLAQREPLTSGRHPTPKLSARALAASQGQCRPATGVQHTVTQAKKARKEAKALDKQVRQAMEDWQRGQSNMSWRSWQAMRRAQQDRHGWRVGRWVRRKVACGRLGCMRGAWAGGWVWVGGCVGA